MEKRCEDAFWSSFFGSVKMAVSEEEAIEAARALSEDRKSRLKRYATGAGIGVTSYPFVNIASEAVKGFTAGAPGKRLSSAAKAVRAASSAPELAKNVTRGGLGAGAVQALRENVQLQGAKKTYESFLREHGAE